MTPKQINDRAEAVTTKFKRRMDRLTKDVAKEMSASFNGKKLDRTGSEKPEFRLLKSRIHLYLSSLLDIGFCISTCQEVSKELGE